MKTENWKAELPQGFSTESRVWIYQANRQLNESETNQLKEKLDIFCDEWMSHGRPVKGWAKILFNQFIVFISDDTQDRLCGSAVDNSIRFIKEIENQFELSLLDRMMMAFLVNDHIKVYPVNKINQALENGLINEDTLYFNNTVTTKSSLENNWIMKLKESWLAKKINLPKMI
ncbi:MAG: hypothetical protein EPN37_01110 [Chitinophagaceae bacterium]|nr:MAG: hypothetical protein EPN37_01110 [Chitinophagaceae bacterium]